MAKEQSSYNNRAMQSGHPAGASTCPNCNAPLYYAAELKLHDRTEKNVVYCSGGCGWLHSVGDVVNVVSDVVNVVKDIAKDAGIAALEVAGEIVAGGAVAE